MNKKRIRVAAVWIVAALAIYALAGFVAVPLVVQKALVANVENKLGHRLGLGAVHFNPFTLAAELNDVDLREASGGPMFSVKRFAVDLQISSLFRRTWTLASIRAEEPAVYLELRKDGRHNFSALLEALRPPQPEPQTSLPPIAIGRIELSGGRIEVADLQAGESARLALAPIAFELTDLTTEPADTAAYQLSARSAQGERIRWTGEISLNPLASSGRLQLEEWNVATLARLLGTRIDLERESGRIDASADYRVGFHDAAPALNLSNISVRLADLALLKTGAGEPLLKLDRLQLANGNLDLGQRRFTADRLEIGRAALALEIAADGSANWLALVPRWAQAPMAVLPAGTALSAQPIPRTQPDATASPAQRTMSAPASPQPTQAAAQPSPPNGWHLGVGRLTLADSTVRFADRRAASAGEIEIGGAKVDLAAELQLGTGATTVTVTKANAAVARAGLTAGEQRIEVVDAKVASDHARVMLAADLQAELSALTIGADTIGVGGTTGTWRVQKIKASAESIRVANSDSGDMRAEARTLALDAAALDGPAGKESKRLFETAALALRAKAIALEPRGEATNLRAEGASASVRSVVARDPTSGKELARLAQGEVTGAAVDLQQRRVTLERVALADANGALVLQAGGQTSWDAWLAALSPPRTAPHASRKASAAEAAPWLAQVRALELRNASAQYTDERRSPPVAIAVQQVHVRARNASTDASASIPIEVAGNIKNGGEFRASGRVTASPLMTDLKLKVAGTSLLPLQPFVAPYARIQIVSALASAEGRLRYGLRKSAGADLLFEGELGLDKAIVEETEPAQPFLSVDSARASQVKLSLSPDRLEIPELRLNGLATRLLIAEDQSVNVAQVLRPQAASTAPPNKGASAAPSNKDAAASPPTKDPAYAGRAAPTESGDAGSSDFPIVLSRVRVDNSVLEFSDLSLRPQFNTRMHELQGVVTGISTSAATRARVELDARVDEYGSAQIRGVMNLFKPRVFTDVTLVFRNLEMTDLTPYAAKFAGYRIASGKLSMDLHYRVKNSALLGDNKIVVDKLELGERVESPSALDLPLELAIAILKDENGRIDIGLPVSGSLEDPQFSIGAIVWKALGSLLGRVVTAPFRALARLFGGDAEDRDFGAIEFDPGVARLAPPEREKLTTVAAGLAKRPDLKLTVKPAYATDADRDALQSIAVRRAVVARAGIKLEAGESPGPLDYGNGRIRQAIDDLFGETFGSAAARDLRASVAKTAPKREPERPEASSAATATDKPAAAATAPAPTAAASGSIRVARAMAQRLMNERAIGAAELNELARARGEAIVAELRDAGKIDAARIGLAAPQAAQNAQAHAITTHLELAVAK